MRTKSYVYLVAVALASYCSSASPTEAIRMALSVPKTDYLVAEPLSLTVQCINNSPDPITFNTRLAVEIPVLYVSVNGGKLEEFRHPDGFQRREDPRSDETVEYPSVQLLPGESFSTTAFVVKGHYGDSGEEFLLFRPGKYRLHASTEGKDGVVIEAALPTTDVDKQALLLWKDRAAGQFTLAPYGTDPKLDALRSLASRFPDSVYTQYARLGIVRQILNQPHLSAKAEPRKEAEVELNRVLQEGGNPAVVEHAIFFKAWEFAKSQGEKKALARELMRVHPKSGYLQRLQEITITCAEDSDAHKNASRERRVAKDDVVRGPVRLSLQPGPLAQMPAGAGTTIKKYWSAICSRDLDAALGCLSAKFMGDDGTKENRRRVWEKHLRADEARELEIDVLDAQRANSYSRPASLPAGKAANFKGEMAIVRARMVAGLEGQRRVDRLVTWVLEAQSDDNWLIVSEYVHPGKDKLEQSPVESNGRQLQGRNASDAEGKAKTDGPPAVPNETGKDDPPAATPPEASAHWALVVVFLAVAVAGFSIVVLRLGRGGPRG